MVFDFCLSCLCFLPAFQVGMCSGPGKGILTPGPSKVTVLHNQLRGGSLLREVWG